MPDWLIADAHSEKKKKSGWHQRDIMFSPGTAKLNRGPGYALHVPARLFVHPKRKLCRYYLPRSMQTRAVDVASALVSGHGCRKASSGRTAARWQTETGTPDTAARWSFKWWHFFFFDSKWWHINFEQLHHCVCALCCGAGTDPATSSRRNVLNKDCMVDEASALQAGLPSFLGGT